MAKKVKQGEGAVGTPEEFPQELFATFDGSGEDRYVCAAPGPEANHLCEGHPDYVATYKLVKVRKLQLEKTVKVVGVK